MIDNLEDDLLILMEIVAIGKDNGVELSSTERNLVTQAADYYYSEMTSSEIIEHLQAENDEEALRELRELFQTADLVKFAKYTTLINENDRNLVTAVEYINQTKIEEEIKPQPTEIVVEEKRSKVAKAILVASITIVAIAIIVLICFLVYRLYYLFI